MSGSVISLRETHQTNLHSVNLRHGRLAGVMLAELADFRGIQISDGQQDTMLTMLGIRVAYK